MEYKTFCETTSLYVVNVGRLCKCTDNQLCYKLYTQYIYPENKLYTPNVPLLSLFLMIKIDFTFLILLFEC